MNQQVFVGFCAGTTDEVRPYVARFDDLHLVTPSPSNPLTGTGDGLAATYADESSHNMVKEIDPQVNFVWQDRGPIPGIGATNFSVYWEGFLEPQLTEPYRLHLFSDGAASLSLDGKTLISKAGKIRTERSAAVLLRAGQRYAIRLEYAQPTVNSTIRLYWSSQNTGKTPIPQSQLYSSNNTRVGVDNGSTNAQTQITNQSPILDSSPPPVIPPGTNSLGTDIQSTQTVTTVVGKNFVAQLGEWDTEGESAFAADGRGSVEYELTALVNDMYQLEIEGASHYYDDPDPNFELGVWIDGEYLGRSTLVAQSSGPGFVHLISPWLKSGTHRVRIDWDNAGWDRSFELAAVRLQSLQGSDSNGNGIKDWVERRLASRCGVDFSQSWSSVSPVCLEGKGAYLSMMEISGGVLPMRGAGERWYADVPLSSETSTTIVCSFQNGGVQTTNQITWRPTNLLQATNLLVRVGDSLLLTACPDGATDGQMQIAVVGLTNYSGAANQPIAHRFTSPGTFTLTGSYLSNSAPTQTGSITVTVLSASLADKPAVWAGKWRLWDCLIPAQHSVQTDPKLTLDTLASDESGISQFALTTGQPEDQYLVERIGPQGAILTNTPAQGFRLSAGYETGINHVATYADGSELVEMGLVLSPVRSQVRVHIEVHAGGVMFDDGTAVKDLGAEAFDVLGKATVRFIRPPTFKTSVCHEISVYQGQVRLGIYP